MHDRYAPTLADAVFRALEGSLLLGSGYSGWGQGLCAVERSPAMHLSQPTI